LDEGYSFLLPCRQLQRIPFFFKTIALKNFKNALNGLWLVSLIAFPIVLWILPADYFDTGGVELCPSQVFFNFECFGCGMTRAVMHFHHWQFIDAIYFNSLVVIVYPLLVLIYFIWLKSAFTALNKNVLKRVKAK